MIHKDKQSKWFSNDTSQTEGVWLGDDPITLANYEGLAKSETESILSEAEIERDRKESEESDREEEERGRKERDSADWEDTKRSLNDTFGLY